MKGEDESSLELLLDTMCNTFGGVIFITIALVVIISMTSSLRQAHDESVNVRDVEELKVILAELQEQLRQADAQQKALETEVSTASSDPRLRLLEEVAALEASVENRELQAEIVRQSLASTQLEARLVEAELQSAQDAFVHHSEEIEENARMRQEMLSQIEALRQEQEDNALNMVFTTLTGRREMPYFLVVQDGRVWRVGPDDEDLTRTHGDVLSKTENQADGRMQVVCKPKPGKGVPIFEGEGLSEQFRRSLSSVPSGRVPCFWVPPESAEVFYALRETLKQEGKLHGFRLLPDKDSYDYLVTPVSKTKTYEY